MTNSYDFLNRWRYMLLAIALLTLLVVQPIASTFGLMKTLFNVLLVIVMGALILAFAADRRWRIVAGVLCGVVAILSLGGQFLSAAGQTVSVSTGHAIGAAFFVVMAGKIVFSVVKSQRLSIDGVFGAVCGYLLLGLAWALAYEMIYATHPDSFQIAPAAAQQIQRSGESRHLFVYYSFVTLTTLGYGDVTPTSTPARTLSWFEAMTGQLYLTVLIAGLVGAMVAARPTPNSLVRPPGDK